MKTSNLMSELQNRLKPMKISKMVNKKKAAKRVLVSIGSKSQTELDNLKQLQVKSRVLLIQKKKIQKEKKILNAKKNQKREYKIPIKKN